jgi:hypothetical protein
MGRAATLIGFGAAAVVVVGAGLAALVGGTAVGAGAVFLAFSPEDEPMDDGVMAAAVFDAGGYLIQPEGGSDLRSRAASARRSARSILRSTLHVDAKPAPAPTIEPARAKEVASASAPSKPASAPAQPSTAAPAARTASAPKSLPTYDDDSFLADDPDDIFGLKGVAEPATTTTASKGYKKASVDDNDDFLATMESAIASEGTSGSSGAAEASRAPAESAEDIDSLLDDFEMTRVDVEDDKKRRR